MKKRKKVTRHRGTHTHGRGFKKKARGSGHRGGVGMAGTGKMADHRKTKVLKKGVKYFGKRLVKPNFNPKLKLKTVNLQRLAENYNGKDKEIVLKNSKLVGKTDLKFPVKIVVDSASKGALESAKKAGATVVLPEVKGGFKAEESEE